MKKMGGFLVRTVDHGEVIRVGDIEFAVRDHSRTKARVAIRAPADMKIGKVAVKKDKKGDGDGDDL